MMRPLAFGPAFRPFSSMAGLSGACPGWVLPSIMVGTVTGGSGVRSVMVDSPVRLKWMLSCAEEKLESIIA